MADKNNNWRSKVNAMMTDKNYAAKAAAAVDNTRKLNIDLMNKSAEDYPALSVGQQTKSPLGLASVLEMQKKQAARATMPDDDSGVADLAVQAYADARKQIGDEVSKQMADDKSMAFVHPMAAGILRSAESMKAGDVQKTFDRMLENNAVRQAIETKANKELTAALGKNPALTEEQQKDIYYKSVQRQIGAISNKVNQYLIDVNAPKDEGEYVLKSAVGNSLIGKLMLQAARNISGLESAEYDYAQQALADYDANKAKWWEQGLGIAGGLVLDAPLMQGIGSAANATMGRATMWGLGKAGGKALQASTVGRIATGAAVSSGTLGGYNTTSALANQLMEGRFDVGEIAASAGHGFMLGALTGGMSPWLRGVSAGMGKAGKVATMTGGLTAEAGIFTASELSEMDNPYDLETIAQVFGKNVAVIGGLKLSNLPKTVKEYKQWYTEGKQSNFTDADYKTMADFARANGYAADDAFNMSADGTYSRSVADRVTGNRTLLTMTKLQGGKEQNLAIEMYNDPNVPLSLKTKIAAKMNLPAPPPVLPNGVRVEGNKAITYYTMSNGQQQVIEVKEFDRPRKARAYANEFSRTTARRNDLLQSEASVNVMMSQPMVVARLNEQAKRNGTTLADEKARMDDILQRAANGTITQEDIAYYRSIVEDDVTTTESLKKDIKDKFGVEIDEVLKKEGNFTAAEDEALTAYGNALRGIIERGNPTTERTATAAMTGIEDYVALNNLGIEQASAILANPEQRAAIEQQTRSHYAAWLKFFDGKMGEDALAQKLGLDLNNTSDLQTFIAEQTYFKTKAADRIAYNTAEAAKQLLERGGGGVRFLDDGRVKLKGVPFAVEVNESIAARYEAAKQGSGEPMQRIVNDALKDIIKQSETPAEPKEPIAEEAPIAEEPMSESEAVTQQMVDARLAEIDTDLQGIEADGVQRMTINDKPVAVIKGRIVADENGQVDKTKSSAEVAYMLLDEQGRPMLNEQGRPIIEVGVKPSNVRVENIEQWRSVDDYKASEEQRIRENNRITDEAMRQVDEQTAVENQVPTEPKTADDLLAMCDGDKALALDVATDELAKAMQAKGKGATAAETIEINKRIRMYQQMVDRLSATEQPESASLPEVEQTETKAEPQVAEDMEFIYQQGLDENHEGMEPMQMADGRYKWVGLQRGELTANMGERDVELLDNLAKKLGVAVIPINVADRAVNGYYKDGNIYVNTNRGAEWTMRWVAGHEMLHDVAKKSPEAYDAYKQAVLDMWGSDYIENQVKQIIEDYAKSGKTIDREQALTELVNDFGGDLFSSRDGLNILDNILKDQSSKGNVGFIDTIKKWWDNIKEFFGMSPYANEVEKKLADAYKSAMKVMADRMGERKVAEQQELVAIGGLKDEAVVDDAISNEGAEMSIVRDRNKIDELEGEELVPMYRTFQVFDGRLYPPMAAVQGGKKVHSVMVGDWWKSDENPDKVEVKIKGSKAKTGIFSKDDDRISKKDGQWVITIDGEDKPLSMREDGSLAYYFNLKKGEKGDEVSDDLDVAYNPYIHMSKSALNDQFKGAYLRPNLVLVEVLVPKSEIDGTNRYRADYAKDGIGIVPWNSGDVIKQAVAAGHPGREVALSRYAKIGRVFTNAEWADRIDEELAPYKDKIVLPFVMFPPEVLSGLANKGYKIEPPTSKKAQPYYEAWLKGEQPTDPDGGDKPIDAEFSIKADKQKQLDIINRTNPVHDDYHTWIRTTDDIKTLQEAVDEVKAEDADYNLSSYPDVSDDMINEALQSGKITIYSSKPIKEGVFVSPSQMQAKDYAGGGRIYSKQVPINDIAWINTDEGMFAPVEYSVKGKQADESVLDYAKRMSEETGKKNLLNGGSYFSGGGLLEEGLKGIVNPTIAVEFNQKVAGVYRNNFGEHIVTADVRNVDPASLVKNIDGPVAYFHASPVCKNFSRAKQSAEELPLDKATAQSTAEFISKVRPKIVTIENVKGYRDSESMKIILDELKKQGYNYDVDVYNAADYGAYTSRERLIVRAVRDWPLPPKPMMMLADDRPSGWLEAVADIIDTLPEKKGGVAKWMDERLMAMGIDYRNIDKPLYVFGSGYSKDRIGYAFADELVPTLRTKGGDVIVMPDGRVLKATPRVLARISGMSDEYQMPKTDDLAHTIVGNGIPVQLTKAVMGSLIENVKSDLDAGNTEYSIIGKRGAANLDKRDETSIRVDNMVTAEEMEKAGKDAKTIRMATGWERGADGKWRYEVDDLSMLPAEQWIGKRGKKLSDIVENAEELFAAYPELANVKIKEGNGKTYGGSYSDGTITLDTYLAKLWMKRLPDSLPRANKFMNETLIHEIQHYIQEKEGFAQGGNEGMILNKDAISEIDALISDSNKLAVQYNDMIAKGVYEGREAIKDKIISLRAEANAIKKKNSLGTEGYRSLAGEVEARNAEFRSNMTDEERANTMLADTEDVAREDQLFLPNDLNESSKGDYSIKQPKDAEYEAKEQWRKDNAGAIASSFFADRRADKAAEVERLKKKISELKADNTKATSEDKAKVREIADEMHKYIKKNIPTENQGDMTRQQFESVLKQLETAVTKQELEKPMQMVEYIGANVARRALTRQMRDFVKNGFKALTPKGLAKPKTVDGVTSRVLGLVKTLYQSMNKNAFGSDLYKLQKQVREEKAKLEQFNADNGGKYQDVVDKVNEILAKTGVDRYEELYKYFDEKQAASDVNGEVLGYIGRMLPLLDSIELTKDQQKQAKADSAIVTKEDLDQLRISLEEKRDKGIMSEEDKAVLDNMPLYEAMLNLHQQQLNIDGPGASSLAMQMKAKVDEIKNYSKGLDGVTDENSKTAIRIKTQIKEANNELQELFAARIVDQKAVNANVGELLDDLKEIRDTGKSKLQEWSKVKQERATRLVKMANESFGKDARGYWTEINSKGKAKRDFINWMNNRKMQLLLSPAMSFEYMLGVMDPRYYTNDSPIYRQFIKSSEGLLKANDNFFEGTESYNNQVNDAIERFIGRNALTNLKEYFERGDRFATRTIPFEIKVDMNGVKEYITKKEEMTRGQAAKIYAWSRMADGMAKLKAHGVTDDTLKEVKAFIGEDYMNFIDWVEDEFFPRLRRERYNPVYKQMYGISMAENDHYFPFAIYQKDVRTEKELEAPDNDTLGGGVVGNLVERKRNNARLDFTAGSPDIFDMITDYGKKMEEWVAYAQVREDLKKVVNDKQFKQHCDMLGTQYYKRFLNAAKVASRLDSESTMHDMDNSAFNKAMKAFASGAISLRVSTALKQLLSAPAFMVHSLDPAFQKELVNAVTPIDVESAIKGLYQLGKGNTTEAKKLLLNENWLGHYNWCVENLPSFRERVALGGAGNPILEQGSWGKFANTVQSVGMLPNRLVDAFTCSVGAKAVYNYSFNKYKKLHSEKTAHNMAVTDAEIAFNSSQQSSNPVFLSPLQVSRNPLWRGIMNYKNAAIGYYRNGMKANVDLYRASKALFGNPKFVINGQEVGFDGNERDAKSVAATAAVRSVMYNFVLNYIWKFGTIGIAGIPTAILLGKKDEDGNISYTEDEIKRAGADNFAWSLFDNATQGMPVISGFANAAKTGYDYGPIMIFNEINSYMKDIHNQGLLSTAVAQSLVDFGLQVGLGVNAEVYGQMYEGLQGIMSDRPLRPEDIMNIIASPRSAISGVTKERVGEYGRLRDYVNDRIASERQLGIDERMDITKVLTGKRALTEKSLNSYIDEYLESKIPGYREIANKPNESQQEELANAKKAANAKLSYAEKFNSSQSSGKNKKVSDDYHTNKSVKLFSKAVGIIRKMVAVGDYETAERIANEMERRVKRGYNPDGKTIEERLENVDVWDSTGTTEQRSADGYSTAFDRAIKGGFDGYFRR